jgi:DNA-binding ferritin-like protein (Dps family)
MIKKLPTKFKNVLRESEDELVHHLQTAYNSLAGLVQNLEAADDPCVDPMIKEHKKTQRQIAESIELFCGGLCDETVNEEIADLQRQLFNAQGVVTELEEQLGKLLT